MDNWPVKTKADEAAIKDGCYFDLAAAERVRGFFRKFLRHSKGQWAGKPFELLNWQWREIILPLFGWRRKDGTRRYRRAYIEVGKKNGKSTLCAGLSLYMLIADGEQGAEVYCLSPETRVLCADLQWREIGGINKNDNLIGFDEYPAQKGIFRKLRIASVVSANRIVQPCYRILFKDGRSVIASALHKWFTRISFNSDRKEWVTTNNLRPGESSIRDLGPPWEPDNSRDAGYLAGVFDGEGCFHCLKTKGRDGFRIGFAQKPGTVLNYTREILSRFGFNISPNRTHKSGTDSFEIRGLYDCFRFLGQICPRRLLEKATQWYEGRTPNHCNGFLAVTGIEYIGEKEVVAIGTSTNTLFAEGLFSHNSAAADRDQASIIFNEAANMVKASPELASHVMTVPSRKTIAFPRSNSVYRALSADVPTKEGLNISALFFDELHAQRTRELWDTLAYGGASRRQPLAIAITTAGWDRNSICWEQHEYAQKVLDGRFEDWSFFPYIAAASEEDDWTTETTWAKANPSLGVTIELDEFRESCKEARASPTKENAFRRYRLCQWTQQDVRWLRMDDWDACNSPVLAKSDGVCYAGLDLSTTTDITALALVFPREGGFDVIPYFWIPADNAKERETKDKVPYLTWARQGLITLTPGNVVDYDVVRAAIVELGKQYDIREIAIDRWNAAQITTQLMGDGFTVVPYGQGYQSMSAPTKELEKLVLGRQISHGGNPILRWMAGNVTVEQDAAGNLKPSKARSTERIDGIVAIIMALGRAVIRPPPSVYEDRGVIVL